MTTYYDLYLEKQEELDLENKKNAKLFYNKILGGIMLELKKELEK